MPAILCYTRRGEGVYPDDNYPGHVAYLCDLEHALHLAISDDGASFRPLRNNTGVLFAECTFTEGNPAGTTKTLIDPWLTRGADGRFVLSMLRRNQNAPDPLSVGSIMLFTSGDLVRYEPLGFLHVAEEPIRHPRCAYDGDTADYEVYWESGQGQAFCARSADLTRVTDVRPCDPRPLPADAFGIEGCVPGNVIEISEDEARRVRMFLDEIRNTGVDPVACAMEAGTEPPRPQALCRYSDGSTHMKNVDWDFSGIDLTRPGEYEIPGRVRVRRFPFPIPLNFGDYAARDINDPNMHAGMSDPCVTEYQGRYYLSSTGNQNIVLRCAETPEGTFAAEPVVICRIPLQPGQTMNGTWAAELHEIDGIPYLFTTICPGGDWTQVKSVVLRCHGDLLDEGAWEAPRYCVKADGSWLTEGGISLDMTWFRDHGVDYVMWSDRKIRYGTEPLVIEPADVYIATIDPAAPWQLTSEPVCILRPHLGWDRCETEVEEGPYLLRHGDELFVTVSGSSTGMSDLYAVGLLRAKAGSDLLNPASWDFWPYPLLTRESVPGEFGPGHNNFVRDPETGDDLMVYHAVPHDARGRTLHRHPAMRRVHWAASGLPYLEMTPERDLDPRFASIVMKLSIRAKGD